MIFIQNCSIHINCDVYYIIFNCPTSLCQDSLYVKRRFLSIRGAEIIHGIDSSSQFARFNHKSREPSNSRRTSILIFAKIRISYSNYRGDSRISSTAARSSARSANNSAPSPKYEARGNENIREMPRCNGRCIAEIAISFPISTGNARGSTSQQSS